MPPCRHCSHEIIQFLKDFESKRPSLPDAVSGHWMEVLRRAEEPNPDWDKATDLCNCIVTVLQGLRGQAVDLRQLDKSQSQVSILLGTIHLGQGELRSARYFFEQAAKQLRPWDYPTFESLAYYGLTLTHVLEGNWSRTLEAAQKALNALNKLPIPDTTRQTRHLQEQIKEKIKYVEQASTRDDSIAPPNIVRIRIVSNIAAGLHPVKVEDVEDSIFLDKDHSNEADFGVKVKGDSMSGDGILSGDIALFCQQPAVEPGEIAAVVITTSSESREALKRFYPQINVKQPNMSHWFLRSSNPSSEHLVVMPNGANEDAIRRLYDTANRSGKLNDNIEYFPNAELAIAGKFVGLIRIG